MTPQHDLPKAARDRRDKWKLKLLDLTLRNRLLNYKDTKRSVPLRVSNATDFVGRMADGKRLTLVPRSGELNTLAGQDTPKDPIRHDRVACDLPPAELEARLVQMDRDARNSIEESGMSTLFVAVGSVVWYESESSDRRLVAPLMLAPATLRRERDKGGRTFTLEFADDELLPNVTLLEKLKEFAFDAASLTSDESGDTVAMARSLFDWFRSRIAHMPRWEVREDVVLSHFSFAKMMMWADLEKHSERLTSNKVVRRLLDRENPPPLATIEEIPEPDRFTVKGDPVLALDADSSQLQAVHAAIRGRTFVLQGPPGTGKSQTITNILASAIASGKRVLFVAEKMAALNVVRAHLQRLGLGPFCLELHSAKAGNKEALKQLEEALRPVPAAIPSQWSPTVQQADQARDELNKYTHALHMVRDSGESAFSVMGRFTRLEAAPRVDLAIPQPIHVTRERLALMRQHVQTLAAAASHAGDLATHPLRGVGHRRWRPGLADDVRDAAELAHRRALALRDALAPMLALLGIGSEVAPTDLSAAEVDWLTRVASHLLTGSLTSTSLLEEPAWEAFKATLQEEVALARQLETDTAEHARRYRASLSSSNFAELERSAQRALASSWPLRAIRMRRVRAALRSHAINPRAPIAHPMADIELASRILSAQARLRSRDCAGRRLLGSEWDAPGSWSKVPAPLAWTERMRELLATRPQRGALTGAVIGAVTRLAGGEWAQGPEGAADRRHLEAIGTKAAALEQALCSLERAAMTSRSGIVGPGDSGLLERVITTTQRWLVGLSQLPDWCAWRDAEALDGVPELVPVARAMAAGHLAPRDAESAFERSFADLWLRDVFASDEALSRFSHARHAQLVARFQECDKRLVALGKEVVRARRQQASPARQIDHATSASELGVLKKQMLLQRGHMPIRALIKKLPTLLPALKPCWLMSPLSVAQYLDPQLPPFDLVVFDEASQIPPEDAIGALGRATEAVIVGDSKQLPPTSFFNKLDSDGDDGDDDDDPDKKDLESILDEAMATSFPELSLRWHYRSRHESLIAFSNQKYYKRELSTFPSPAADTRGMGVRMVYLPDGRYDKGGSRTNRREAEEIVAELVRRLTSDDGDAKSVGVVTFSSTQQKLIEDLLDATRRASPEIERFFIAGPNVPEPVFIKNLENVQGDERDAILLSVCYGPHGDGQISMNFGPINREGGERRLNVAITRAKREVVVFSSLRAEQIDLSRTTQVGAAHLKAYLDFAERGARALLEESQPGNATESPFEEAVHDALVKRGHLVDVQVGCSDYRIDLAIKDPQSPGRYLLGIECDGAAYHSSRSARERDRLREHVLRGLGWRLHRVWSTDWFQSPEAALQRIEAAIREATAAISAPSAAQSAQPSPQVTPPVTSEASSVSPGTTVGRVPSFASDIVPPGPMRLSGWEQYSEALLPERYRDGERLKRGDALSDVASDIVDIVKQESPVHLERVRRIIGQAWNVTMAARAKDTVARAVDLVLSTSKVYRDGDFLLSTTTQPERFRVPTAFSESVRPVDEIYPEEIALAAKAVLEHDGSMPIDSLCDEVARVFGVKRVHEGTRAIVRASVDRLVRSGRCRIDARTISPLRGGASTGEEPR